MNKQIKQAGFKSISDMERKTGKNRRFILKGHKITQMLLDALCEKKVLKAQISLHDEILDRKNNEIDDLKAKFEALEMLYKASKSNNNEKRVDNGKKFLL